MRQAVEQLTVWAKSAYRMKDNAFISMLADSASMQGYVCKQDEYFGPKGRFLKAGHQRADYLWGYALAYHLSREPFPWETARNIPRGNARGDLGDSPK